MKYAGQKKLSKEIDRKLETEVANESTNRKKKEKARNLYYWLRFKSNPPKNDCNC